METIALSGKAKLPRLGLRTWNLGDQPQHRAEQIRALQRGIDLGMNLVDTAEMYGEGRSEELVAEAIRPRRDDVFLVTKVLPRNATRKKDEHRVRIEP